MSWMHPAWEQLQESGRTILRLLPGVFIAALFLAVVVLVARSVRASATKFAKSRQKSASLAILTGRIAQAGLVFIGVLIAATIAFPSFRASHVIQLLGMSSLAIGFAFRDIFQNFLAGVLILWSQPFRVNDHISFGAFEGTVEDIQTRATFLRTYDGRRVVIPNADLYTGSVIVNTAYPYRRVEYDVSIGAAEDINVAKEAILESLAQSPEVLREPPPDVCVVELGDSGAKLRVRWWIGPSHGRDLIDARDAVLRQIKARFFDQRKPPARSA